MQGWISLAIHASLALAQFGQGLENLLDGNALTCDLPNGRKSKFPLLDDAVQIRSPWIDDELVLVQDQISRFIARDLAPQAQRWERDRQVDRQSWCKAAEAGLICTSIPEVYGGGGGTLAHEAIIQQELARAGLGGTFGVCISIQSAIVANYILAYGTEAQKQRWLPAMARADLIAAMAMTEPGAGSNLQNIRTRATPTLGGYRLTGQKTFVGNGQIANLVLVAARTKEAAGSTSISLLAIETETAKGFQRGGTLEKLGVRVQDTSELLFDDVFVPHENLLGGEPGNGFAQLMDQLAWERMVIALNATVAMERAVELTVAYVRQRMAFGSRLIDYQNPLFVLGDAKAQASVSRELVDSLMVKLLGGSLDATQAAIAKLWTTETAFKVIDACQQLFSGYGYMDDYPIARLLADAQVARVQGGANEIMKLIIARSL